MMVGVLHGSAESSVTVANKNYVSGQPVGEWAQNTITTSGSVVVGSGADVNFSTGTRITLNSGFKVESGATFSALVSSSPPFNPGGYYDAFSPTLTLLSGDQQTGQVGQFNANPFDIAVWNSAGNAPLANAPLLITVSIGDGWLSGTNDGNAILSKSLQLTTDNDGTAQGYYKHALVPDATNIIKIVAGDQSVQAITYTIQDLTIPSIPTDLVAGNLATTSFTLNWTAATDDIGVVGYDVFKNGTLIGSSVTLSFAVTDLLPLTSYSMTVKARDGDNKLSAESAALAVITLADTSPPTAPSGLSMSGLLPSGVTLTWSASTDNVSVVGYDIFANGTLIGSSATLNYTATSLTPATNYSITVKAKDAAGNLSAASQPLSVTTSADITAPSTPLNLVATNVSTTSFTLGWGASSDNVQVTGYDIFSNGVQLGSSPTPSYTAVGLAPGTTYSMTVKAKDASGNVSAPSTALPVTTATDLVAPTVPTGLIATNQTATQFTLTWNAASDNIAVTGYDIFRNGTLVVSTSALSCEVANLAPLTVYSMTVKARDAVGNLSGASVSLSVTTTADTTAPDAPSGLSASELTLTSFVLSWAASTDNVATTGYDVFKDGVQIGSTVTLGYTVTGLTPGNTYTMTVKAKDAAANLSVASVAGFVTMPADTVPPSIPLNLTATAVTTTGLTLGWNVSTDNFAVAGYDLYQGSTLIASPVINTYTVTGLLPATNYSYTVKARDAFNNTSAASEVLSVATLVPRTPVAEVSGSFRTGKTSAPLPTGPNRVLVFIAQSETSGTLNSVSYGGVGLTLAVKHVNGTNEASIWYLTETGLGSATNTTFVTSWSGSEFGEGYSSFFLTGVDQHAPLKAVRSLADPYPTANVSVSTTSITVNNGDYSVLAAVRGNGPAAYTFGGGYTERLFYTIDSGDAAVATQAIIIDGTVTPAVAHAMGGNRMTLAACVFSPAPPIPANLIASNITSTGFSLSWSTAADSGAVTGYDVFKDGALVVSPTAPNATITGLVPGTTYSMTVKAKNAVGGSSGASSALAVTTLIDAHPPSVPNGLAASSIGATSFTLNWNASTDNVGVTGYDIYINGALRGSTTAALVYVVTDLASATTYIMTVMAKDGVGNRSVESDELSVATTQLTPGDLLDSDTDGLLDSWELYYFGNLTRDGSGDWNNDGLLDRDAFRFDINPQGADESAVASKFDTFNYDSRGWLDEFSLTGSASASFSLDNEGNIETAN